MFFFPNQWILCPFEGLIPSTDPGIVEEENEGEDNHVHLHVTPVTEDTRVEEETDDVGRHTHEEHTEKLKRHTHTYTQLLSLI